MSWCEELFGTNKPIIGMVHLKALPGTANFDGDMEKVYTAAIKDAKALEEGGVNGIMVENDGDMPFSHLLSIEQTAALAALTAVIKEHTNIPIGVDAAFSDYKSALACAKGARADFIRLAVFVDTVVSFNGVMEACSGEALKYRKAIDATEVKILADVQVKYTHMLNSNISLEESAVWAGACGADGVIVTGSHTGGETPLDAVKRVKSKVKIPVFIGSGVTTDNADEQLDIADGAIVGSSLKTDGVIDSGKVRELMDKIEK
ncbi:BtpA/SgcQ family protein [Vallitalea maricola]|uniref:BtpA/SgcQ family protein n=1 Tax=Vallitalea maricola TaxID=3074433 RepID=A0ACB5UF09_9FIRM|nr:BtpA/SgcQ family protein [Vallitalea sp. AN17-2]